MRSLRPGENAESANKVKSKSSDRIWVSGKKSLKSSEAYTPAFGAAVADVMAKLKTQREVADVVAEEAPADTPDIAKTANVGKVGKQSTLDDWAKCSTCEGAAAPAAHSSAAPRANRKRTRCGTCRNCLRPLWKKRCTG